MNIIASYAYFIPLLILSFLSLGKERKIILFCFVLFLFCFSAFRYNVGFDFQTYLNIFYEKHILVTPEPLFEYSMLLSRWLESPLFFFAISSFIIVFGVSVYIFREAENPSLGLAIFYAFPLCFMTSMSIIRQWVAVSMFLLIYSQFKASKIRLIFFGVLPLGYHFSAVICLIVPFIIKVLGVTKSISFYIVFLLLAFLLSLFLMFIVESYFPIYKVYVASFDNGASIVMLYVFSWLFLFVMHKVKKIGEPLHLNMAYISIVLMVCLYRFGEAAMRASIYFVPFFIPLFVSLVERLKPVILARIMMLLLCFVLLFVQVFLAWNNPDKNPYPEYSLSFGKF